MALERKETIPRFEVTHIEDSAVRIFYKNREFWFEIDNSRATGLPLLLHDEFIARMQNSRLSLPPIDNVRLVSVPHQQDLGVSTPATNITRIEPYTWGDMGAGVGLRAREMERMYNFARRQLYDRYKARLRDAKS